MANIDPSCHLSPPNQPREILVKTMESAVETNLKLSYYFTFSLFFSIFLRWYLTVQPTIIFYMYYSLTSSVFTILVSVSLKQAISTWLTKGCSNVKKHVLWFGTLASSTGMLFGLFSMMLGVANQISDRRVAVIMLVIMILVEFIFCICPFIFVFWSLLRL